MPSDECSKELLMSSYIQISFEIAEALEDLNVLKKLLHS